MRLGEFARDMTAAPSSEDQVVVCVNGDCVDVAAIQFIDGQVQILTGEANPQPQPVALAEQTAEDQAALGGLDGPVPGHADVMNQVSTGEGIASDLRGGDVKTEPDKDQAWADRGQEYHAGPEQPRTAVPVEDNQVAEDSGT